MFSFLLILILDMQPLLFAFQYDHTQFLKQLRALKNSESKPDNINRGLALVLIKTVKKKFYIFIF